MSRRLKVPIAGRSSRTLRRYQTAPRVVMSVATAAVSELQHGLREQQVRHRQPPVVTASTANVASARSARTWRRSEEETSTAASMPRSANRQATSAVVRPSSADSGMVSSRTPPSSVARYLAGHGWLGSASRTSTMSLVVTVPDLVAMAWLALPWMADTAGMAASSQRSGSSGRRRTRSAVS